MSLGAVENSIRRVERLLLGVVRRRERLLKESREVISSSSRAIVDLHVGEFESAKKELDKARKLLSELKADGSGVLARYLISPESEFVEASVVNAIVRGRSIPSLTSLDASPEAYLLGLLDAIGELKRLVMDSIMNGGIDKAKSHFSAMEKLYSLLSPFAAFDNVVNGVRRKIDVARALIEDVRGILAEEARRERLVSSMERLYNRLEDLPGRG